MATKLDFKSIVRLMDYLEEQGFFIGMEGEIRKEMIEFKVTDIITETYEKATKPLLNSIENNKP